MKEANPKSLSEKIRSSIDYCIHFISEEIWRVTENEVSGLKQFGINIVKTGVLALRGFHADNLLNRASALTFNTFLAIVPMLAILLGIAKGFGLQNVVEEELSEYLPGQKEQLIQAYLFVDNYLKEAQGGIFLGLSMLMLLYTVISLISSIEQNFNDLWYIRQSRPFHRKVSDYLALFILLPVMLTASSGLSIFVTTLQNTLLSNFLFFTPVVDFTLRIAPFVITSLMFSAIYTLLPNTKVNFLNGLISGILLGCVFQVFQYLYINGQIWVSRQNAIYGSFAAIPLLLLWIQASWIIILFGAKLTYASQNVKKFSFEKDTKHISRRYKDFVTLLITTLIVKRFEQNEAPYTADELSESYCIPTQITTLVLNRLLHLQIINEVRYGKDERIIHYQPAMDINQISVSLLMERIDSSGSENFKIDIANDFQNEWKAILKTRRDSFEQSKDLLLKDL